MQWILQVQNAKKYFETINFYAARGTMFKFYLNRLLKIWK